MKSAILALGLTAAIGLTACSQKEREAEATTGTAEAEVSTTAPESVISDAQLQSQARGAGGLNVPHSVLGDHLALSLVYDLPQAMRSIGHDDLKAWGTTFYEAQEVARHNLEQLGNVSFANINNR